MARLPAQEEALVDGAFESHCPAGGTPRGVTQVLTDKGLVLARDRKAKSQQKKGPGWEGQCPLMPTRAGHSG